MNRIYIRKRLVFGLASVVILLVVNAAYSYRNTVQLYDDAGWVSHTLHVIAQIDEVTTSLIEAQDGYRGYVATASEKFLQPYHAATAKAPLQIAALRQMTMDIVRPHPIHQPLDRMVGRTTPSSPAQRWR